jgi:integrase
MRRGERLHGRSFAHCADAFLEHADLLREVSDGQRKNYKQKWNLLKEHFDGVKVTDVDTKFLLELRENARENRTRTAKRSKLRLWKRTSTSSGSCCAKYIEECLDELPEFPSFRGEAWEVVPSPRPFLDHEQWVKLRKLAKARIGGADLNPRTKQQRQELYWFLLICVGAAVRVGEAYSLRWRDCELITLNDKDKTEAVHM